MRALTTNRESAASLHRAPVMSELATGVTPLPTRLHNYCAGDWPWKRQRNTKRSDSISGA